MSDRPILYPTAIMIVFAIGLLFIPEETFHKFV
jgi:hypothetical protein